MFVITFKGNPATVEKLHDAESKVVNHLAYNAERESYLSAPTAKQAKAAFLHWFGFTWKERAEGIDVAKVVAVKSKYVTRCLP